MLLDQLGLKNESVGENVEKKVVNVEKVVKIKNGDPPAKTHEAKECHSHQLTILNRIRCVPPAKISNSDSDFPRPKTPEN